LVLGFLFLRNKVGWSMKLTIYANKVLSAWSSTCTFSWTGITCGGKSSVTKRRKKIELNYA
jgi:hypothetical protein